jgi:hypothetical protein
VGLVVALGLLVGVPALVLGALGYVAFPWLDTLRANV